MESQMKDRSVDFNFNKKKYKSTLFKELYFVPNHICKSVMKI